MGKLNVHDSMAAYLPGVPADKRQITLHELLTHTAGLQSDYGGDYEKIGRDAFVARVMAAPLETMPGRRFSYANAGYGLLAAIVERVSGTSYERFLRDNLFLRRGCWKPDTAFRSGRPRASQSGTIEMASLGERSRGTVGRPKGRTGTLWATAAFYPRRPIC